MRCVYTHNFGVLHFFENIFLHTFILLQNHVCEKNDEFYNFILSFINCLLFWMTTCCAMSSKYEKMFVRNVNAYGNNNCRHLNWSLCIYNSLQKKIEFVKCSFN